MRLREVAAVNDAPWRLGRSAGEIASTGQGSWARRAANELAGLAWSPMVWILLGLVALAEVGNWQIAGEMALVCELLERGEIASAPPGLSRTEIDDICRNHSPRQLYRSR